MAAKVPTTPEDVIALVGDSGMQQLIAQAQAQQAQAVVDAHHALVEHAAAAGVSVTTMTDVDVHMVAAAAAAVANDSAASMLGKVEPSAMDFMSLPSATVVLGSSSAVAAVDGVATDAGGAVPMSIDVAGGSSSGASAGGSAAPAGNAVIKRKSIPLSMKKEAIEWIMGPGKGVPSRAEKHFSVLNWDVSASSFRKWWKNREKILSDASHKKRITGGGRKPYLELSEEKLLVVVIQERAKKDRVTRKWIAKTAQHMFQRTNASFKASENWVTKFIRRNGLTLKRSYVTYEQQHAGFAHGAAANGTAGDDGVDGDSVGGGGSGEHPGGSTSADVDDDIEHHHHQHIEIDVDDDGSGEHEHDGDAREHVVDDEQRKTVVV